ncbi:hypothetical protein J2S30_001271 [Herbaspirillum rubrisubalbicans]|nr:hypothetical protein [Herbaspirillum rubrisubalbicans]
MDEAAAQGKGSDVRRAITAVAAPVDDFLVARDLALQVLDVGRGPCAARDDDDVGGAIADHVHEEPVARFAGNAGRFGQVLEAEEYGFASVLHASADDVDLWLLCHALSWCDVRPPLLTHSRSCRSDSAWPNF